MKKKNYTLRSHLNKMIVLCVLVAVIVQGVVMTAMIMNSYVRQSRVDTEYIVKSTNEIVNSYIQFLKEIVIAIRNNDNLTDFFTGESYNQEDALIQLEKMTELFSERNRINAQYPFVDKIYIFNNNAQCIYDTYYPYTIAQKKEFERKYMQMNEEFLKQEEEFQYETDEECLYIFVRLYSQQKMEPMGSCIAALNVESIRKLYEGLDKYRSYIWQVKCGKEIHLENNCHFGDGPLEKGISDVRKAGFGIQLRIAVSNDEIYRLLGNSLVIFIGISVLLLIMATLLSRVIAYHFTKPLQNVADTISQFGKENFDTKLENCGIEEMDNISDTFNDMTDRINLLIKEVYESQLIAKQAQIQYLQAQMNPHFMFNVLSMIQFKAAVNHDEEVQKMLYMFSKILQGKIFRNDEIRIRLKEEMEVVEFYLHLQGNRFGNKITYDIDYGEGGREAFYGLLVPRLCIEPIVENAVCHGLEPKDGNGHISVKIRLEEKRLLIEVKDDGVGFDMNQVEQEEAGNQHTHVGIINTRRMIQNLCGEEYGIEVTSSKDAGTDVLIVLPVERSK